MKEERKKEFFSPLYTVALYCCPIRALYSPHYKGWQVALQHRRSIKTEEKAKVVPSLLLFRGQTWFNSLPLYSYFAPGWFEERDEFILFFISPWCNSYYSTYRPGAIHPILLNVLMQNSQRAATTYAFSSVFILLLGNANYTPPTWIIPSLRNRPLETVRCKDNKGKNVFSSPTSSRSHLSWNYFSFVMFFMGWFEITHTHLIGSFLSELSW